MRRITIGFSKPKNKVFPIFSLLIRLVERTEFSHVFVKMDSASLGTTLIYQASGTQVNFMGLKQFEDAAHIHSEFEFEVSDETYREFLRWAVREAGTPYGLKPVLGILAVKWFNLGRNPFSDGSKTWFCSELGARVLKGFVGVHISEKELETAGPKKIYEICVKLKEDMWQKKL